MRKSLIILAFLPCIALAGPPFHHQVPCGDFPHLIHPSPGDDADRLPGFLHGINLSDQQQSDIKNLLKSNRAKFDSQLEEIKKAETELYHLSFSNDFSNGKIQALADKSVAAHKELAIQKAALDNTIYKLLNNEQKQKLQSEGTQFEMACGNGL